MDPNQHQSKYKAELRLLVTNVSVILCIKCYNMLTDKCCTSPVAIESEIFFICKKWLCWLRPTVPHTVLALWNSFLSHRHVVIIIISSTCIFPD